MFITVYYIKSSRIIYINENCFSFTLDQREENSFNLVPGVYQASLCELDDIGSEVHNITLHYCYKHFLIKYLLTRSI